MNKKRILVVDDEESLCEIISFNLEVEGYEVVTAQRHYASILIVFTSFCSML